MKLNDLVRIYRVVMLLVISVIVVAQGIMLVDIADDSNYATTINLAGRQRMLSQYIAKDLLEVALNPDSPESEEHLEDTREGLDLLSRVNTGLQVGDEELGIDAPDDLAKAIAELQTPFRDLYTSGECLHSIYAGIPNAACTRTEAEYLALLSTSNETFLELMDPIVVDITEQATFETHRVVQLGFVFSGLMIATLVSLSYFVIRPAVQRTIEAQSAAETSNARFQQMASTLRDMFWLKNAKNNTLEYLSPAYEKIWGRSIESALMNPLSVQNAIHEQDRLRLTPMIQKQEGYDETYRVLRPDGTMKWVREVTFPVRDASGTVTQIIGSARDVTVEKETEAVVQSQNEALVKANRDLAVSRRQADAANKLKSQFLATMSHELRTPLNAVIGYSQLQLAGMVGEMTEEQRGFQDRILINAQHLLGLINEVLDLSKIEAGRMELNDRPFSLRDTLKTIYEQNRVLAEAKNLLFTLEIDERLPDIIVADVGRIKQVIINMISNGIKYTDEGSVLLSATIHDKDSWRVTVTDTGIGIAPHLQETIFDEFRQAENGIHRGGTGLGLAIVRKLVLMMGGNIRVSSELGKGSTFTLTLPLVTRVDPMAEFEVVV